MVKYHSDNETGNLLPPLHRLLFLISTKGLFYMHYLTHKIAYASFGALAGMRNNSMGPP